MCFCSILAHLTVPLAVRSSAVPAISIDTDTYLRAIAPIGACYALSLWVGNAAFLYLSVSFRQMFNVSSTCQCVRWPAGLRAGVHTWPILTHILPTWKLCATCGAGLNARDSVYSRLHVRG